MQKRINGYDIVLKLTKSGEGEGVFAVSQTYDSFNIGIDNHKDYKYMIDTKVNSNYPNHLLCNEVLFEPFSDIPISINSIVGYFKGSDCTKFYMNDEYTGNFSWDAENVVENYNQQIETAKCVIL